jgi:hypothetical protein
MRAYKNGNSIADLPSRAFCHMSRDQFFFGLCLPFVMTPVRTAASIHTTPPLWNVHGIGKNTPVPPGPPAAVIQQFTFSHKSTTPLVDRSGI